MWRTSDGFLPKDVRDIKSVSMERADVARTRIAITRYLKRETFEPPLMLEELMDYLHPTAGQLAPFMVILAMLGIDPVPILRLERKCLIDAVGHPGKKNLIWTKQRAGGENDRGPFEVGGNNARTIPQAMTILDTITAGLRAHASEDLSGYMFLQAADDDDDLYAVSLCGTDASHTMKVFRRILHHDTTPVFDILRKIEGNVSLKAVRTTVGSLKTYKGGYVEAQEFFLHSRPSTTMPYINNSEYKRFLERQISEAQSQLVTHLSQQPKIVLPDVDILLEEEGLAPMEAHALIAGELDNGIGISLINGCSYVLDDPLIYLRMKGWLGVVEAASERLRMENLQRWEAYWTQQIRLLRMTLDNFLRVTRAQAAQMTPPDFVYPEPH